MAAKDLKRGIFITLEGIEGSGKTTHAKLLAAYLKGRGYRCLAAREPGGTSLGESVRTVLLHSKDIKISDMAELFLFEACRAEIVDEVIKPALARKTIVICDRFSDATFSYQGYGGGIPLDRMKTLDKISTGGLKPDITILLDIDADTGLRRARRKGADRMEKKDAVYHRRVRAGYLKLAKGQPRRIKTIKVKGSIEETQKLIRREVEIVIQRYIRTG